MKIISFFRNMLLITIFVIVVVSIFLSFGLILMLYNIIQEKKRSKEKNDR